MNLNKVMLAGNMTRDVEVRFTQTGTAIGNFGLAVNRRWKDQNGEQKEEVTFIDVTVFGRTAENIAAYCKKGSPLFIEGRLKLDQWDDRQTGQKRQKLGVIAETFQFLNGKRSEHDQPDPPEGEPVTRRTKPAMTEGPTGTPVEEDDVPF